MKGGSIIAMQEPNTTTTERLGREGGREGEGGGGREGGRERGSLREGEKGGGRYIGEKSY